MEVINACRFLYNKVLEVRKSSWEEDKVSLGLFDTMKFLPGWKSDHTFLNKVYSQVLQNVCVRVDLAMKAFFRRCKTGETPGFPRFRGTNRYDSFTFPQFPHSGFKFTTDNKLSLSKIGCIKIVLHRKLIGKVKTLTIKCTPTGKWFAYFVCDVEKTIFLANPKAVGIDMGLTKFATLSTSEVVKNPRFFKTAEKSLAKVQRRFDREKVGTTARSFRRNAVALTHEKIVNRRKDFAHKLSNRLVREFGTLCFENLNTKDMVKGWLAKSIHDAAWNQLISFTADKAECAGRSFVLVNPRNTTKMCSQCGVLVEKDLSVRIHDCPSCGLKVDRDYNAALNILRLGLESLTLTSIEAPAVNAGE